MEQLSFATRTAFQKEIHQLQREKQELQQLVNRLKYQDTSRRLVPEAAFQKIEQELLILKGEHEALKVSYEEIKKDAEHHLRKRQELKEQLERRSRLQAPPEYIEMVVYNYYKQPMNTKGTKSRKAELVLPRQMCMFLMAQFTSLGLKAIGGRFGGRDHTTVIHAKDVIRDRMDADRVFRDEVALLSSLITRKEKSICPTCQQVYGGPRNLKPPKPPNSNEQ